MIRHCLKKGLGKPDCGCYRGWEVVSGDRRCAHEVDIFRHNYSAISCNSSRHNNAGYIGYRCALRGDVRVGNSGIAVCPGFWPTATLDDPRASREKDLGTFPKVCRDIECGIIDGPCDAPKIIFGAVTIAREVLWRRGVA